MQLVRTILGDIAPERLGVVNAHDHLIRVGVGEVYIDPDHQLADVDKAVEEATRFVTASKNWAATGTVVDLCPANCGRDLNRLVEVNRRVPDLHVVAATGFHREHVYLETGVYLEIDGTYRIKYQPDSNRITELRELGERGHGKRILLGTDSGKRSYQKAYGAVTGVDFNPANDGPRMLDEGFDRAYVEDLLMHNGQRFFAFVEED